MRKAYVAMLFAVAAGPVACDSSDDDGPSKGDRSDEVKGVGSGDAAADDVFGNAPMQTPLGDAGIMQPLPDGGKNLECATAIADTRPIEPTVWLIVDGSSSMDMDFDGAATRWQTLRSTLMDQGGVIESLQSSVRFGMVLYSGADSDQCANLVTIEPALDNYDAIDAQYPQAPIGTGTPTDKAVQHVVENLPVLNEAADDRDGDPIYVVLATDGAPNDACAESSGGSGPSGGDPVVMERVVDAVGEGTGMGMQMYVISLAGDDVELQDHLEDVAAATSSQTPPFVPSTKADLIATFGSVVSDATCQIAIDGMVKKGQECRGRVTLNGDELPCRSDNGWRLLDPSTIQLTGTACDTFLGTASEVVAAFPCGVLLI